MRSSLRITICIIFFCSGWRQLLWAWVVLAIGSGCYVRAQPSQRGWVARMSELPGCLSATGQHGNRATKWRPLKLWLTRCPCIKYRTAPSSSCRIVRVNLNPVIYTRLQIIDSDRCIVCIDRIGFSRVCSRVPYLVIVQWFAISRNPRYCQWVGCGIDQLRFRRSWKGFDSCR